MTHLVDLEPVREILGERIHFIAVPNFRSDDMKRSMGQGFLKDIEAFHAAGTRICKFWAAPRAKDYAIEWGDPNSMNLDSPQRIEHMELAHELGMSFMTHVADPNTWFEGKYHDAGKYGTKQDQYEPLEQLLDRFTQPWIAAHMGGWPEDLEFLTGLLTRHNNLYLDTSATKWMVRELSRHSRAELLKFLQHFQGRILFGSDIVSSDDHLDDSDSSREMSAKASTTEQAFDLYASRYWALRMLWESDYEGESPIADPDLAMLDPEQYSEMDAPQLCGKGLPPEILQSLYHDAAQDLLGGE